MRLPCEPLRARIPNDASVVGLQPQRGEPRSKLVVVKHERTLSARASAHVCLVPPFLLSNIIPVAIAIPPLLFNLQNRVIPTPESPSRGVPKMVPFLVPFWSQFWPRNGHQNGPKTGQKHNKFGVHFWNPFFSGFGALWVPLGSLLGLFEAVLGGLGPQKP